MEAKCGYWKKTTGEMKWIAPERGKYNSRQNTGWSKIVWTQVKNITFTTVKENIAKDDESREKYENLEVKKSRVPREKET